MIIRPSTVHPSYWGAKRKPMGEVALNRNHPIASRISFCVFHGLQRITGVDNSLNGVGAQHDLVNNKYSSIPKLGTLKTTSDGIGFHQPASASSDVILAFNYPGTVTSNGSGTGDFTMATYFVVNNTSGSQENLFGQTSNTPSFRDAGLFMSIGQGIGIFRDGTNSGVTANTMTPGIPALAAGTRSGSTLTAYLNGTASTTGSNGTDMATSAAVYYAAYPNTGGFSNSGGGTADYTFLWSAMWNRALSQQELTYLSAFPYALFEPRYNTIDTYAASGAGPGGGGIGGHAGGMFLMMGAGG